LIANLASHAAMMDSGVSWLGKIPADWEVCKVRGVARVINGFPFDAGRFSMSSGFPLVRIRDLNKAQTAMRYDGDFVESARVDRGDLLIGMDGDFGVGTWAGSEPALLNQRVCCVRSAQPTTQHLLKYLLPLPLKEINDVTWSTTVKHLASGQVERITFGLPSPHEQAAIVRFLDYADRRIRRYIGAKQKLIRLLDEQRQSIIDRTITHGLDPDVRLKPSGLKWLGDVPEHWQVRRAKYLFREVDERSTTGEEELLSVSHITGVTSRSERNVTMFMASTYVGHKLCEPGDLVVNTMWAWAGALGVARKSGIVSPSYGVYRPLGGSELLSEYADLLLRTAPFKSEYLCLSTGIRRSRLRLYPERFLTIPIACPPLREQQEILDRVGLKTAKTQEAMASAQRGIDLWRECQTRLIGDVVTGKLDVREAASELPDEGEATAPSGNSEEVLDSEDLDVDAEMDVEETEA